MQELLESSQGTEEYSNNNYAIWSYPSFAAAEPQRRFIFETKTLTHKYVYEHIHLLFCQESKYHQTSSTSSRVLWMSFSPNLFPLSLLMASCFWKFQIHLKSHGTSCSDQKFIAYGLHSWLNQTSAENHGKWTHSYCVSEIMYTRIMHMHALCDMVCMHRQILHAGNCML